MRRRDKLSVLYSYVKKDVVEMFYRDKTKKTVCILVHGWYTPSWFNYDGQLITHGDSTKHLATTYFGLKVWIVTHSQKDYWEELKIKLGIKQEDIYGITIKKKHKGKLIKLKAKR
jgi:hypothetical protein